MKPLVVNLREVVRVDRRLISQFTGLGAYFLARFFAASVLASIAIAVIVGVVVYAVARRRSGG